MDTGLARLLDSNSINKRIQALMGIVTGVMADGILNDSEVLFLRAWLTENSDLTSVWPASALHSKIEAVLADGQIDAQEREHLAGFLAAMGATDFAQSGSAGTDSTSLPIEDCVTVTIADSSVCHTGEFLFGTRAACERATLRAGGMPADNVSRRVDILVIGTKVSPHWANTSYGRKIEAAVRLQEGGHPIEIISERRWLEALKSDQDQAV